MLLSSLQISFRSSLAAGFRNFQFGAQLCSDSDFCMSQTLSERDTSASPASAEILSSNALSTLPTTPDLSLELLELILFHLDKRDHILACQTVCKRWENATRRPLWHRVSLRFGKSGGSAALIELTHLMIRRPDLAVMVRELVWGPLTADQYSELWTVEGDWDDAMHGSAATVGTLLLVLPNLAHLELPILLAQYYTHVWRAVRTRLYGRLLKSVKIVSPANKPDGRIPSARRAVECQLGSLLYLCAPKVSSLNLLGSFSNSGPDAYMPPAGSAVLSRLSIACSTTITDTQYMAIINSSTAPLRSLSLAACPALSTSAVFGSIKQHKSALRHLSLSRMFRNADLDADVDACNLLASLETLEEPRLVGSAARTALLGRPASLKRIALRSTDIEAAWLSAALALGVAGCSHLHVRVCERSYDAAEHEAVAVSHHLYDSAGS